MNFQDIFVAVRGLTASVETDTSTIAIFSWIRRSDIFVIRSEVSMLNFSRCMDTVTFFDSGLSSLVDAKSHKKYKTCFWDPFLGQNYF